MGKEPVYDFLPWNGARQSVKNGVHWGTFPYAITDERKADFTLHDPSLRHELSFALKQISFSELAESEVLITLEEVRGNFYETMFSEAGISWIFSNDGKKLPSEKLFTDRARHGRCR
jgi:hypothetical protein